MAPVGEFSIIKTFATMQIFRVIISFLVNQMQHLHERASFAMSAGQALDQVLWDLHIDTTKCENFQAQTHKPLSLTDFGRDALVLPVSGAPDIYLADLWRSRPHGI